jgi:hypothetical protein
LGDELWSTCENCHCNVRFDKPDFERPGFYKLRYRCECGHTDFIGHIAGELIPEASRAEAEHLHQAIGIGSKIDERRRSLPPSPGKTLLRQAKVTPIRLEGDLWLVFELPDQWKVTYAESTEDFEAILSDGRREKFADVKGLAAWVGRL